MERDAEQANDDGRGPCVVILCAQEIARDLLAYWLGSLPLRSVVVRDGYAANALLRTLSAGLLVTDRALPPWPGLDTFRQIVARNPRIGVAVIEDGTPDSAALARSTGATIVLHRPLTRRGVVEALGLPPP